MLIGNMMLQPFLVSFCLWKTAAHLSIRPPYFLIFQPLALTEAKLTYPACSSY